MYAPADWDEAAFARKAFPVFRVRTASETVIGEVRHYRIRAGDTLLDVARWFDLGYNEIVEANPGVDPWVPPAGADVVVPTEFVLPCCSYEGLVVNIPEMRIYYFRPVGGDARTTLVTTYPVGLGRADRRTPRGRYRVRAKQVNPRWDIPESIWREHVRERGDARRAIAGGAPDNPLGRYRLQLTHRLYGIHGTDVPWGIGMEVTHGCVRLYLEDIERLFPLVPVGTPVEFVYQPVKVGQRGGVVYVEAHRDIYRFSRSLAAEAQRALALQKVGDRVDARRLRGVLGNPAGVPLPVSADGRRAS